MKKILILLIITLTINCSSPYSNQFEDLGLLLSNCKTYGVLVQIEYREGNPKGRRHYYFIKDANNIVRTYIGGTINIAIGDTLIKNNTH